MMVLLLFIFIYLALFVFNFVQRLNREPICHAEPEILQSQRYSTICLGLV